MLQPFSGTMSHGAHRGDEDIGSIATSHRTLTSQIRRVSEKSRPKTILRTEQEVRPGRQPSKSCIKGHLPRNGCGNFVARPESEQISFTKFDSINDVLPYSGVCQVLDNSKNKITLLCHAFPLQFLGIFFPLSC